MEQYTILGRIGEGAHGIVFKAKHIESGEIVALKKVSLRKLEDGIPNSALREIKALREIEDNPHIVKLREMFPHGTGFILVFEYMLSDLSEVIRHCNQPLSEAHVKSYMLMLLKGVAFMHKNHIMHRDLKPANLLISSTGHLKIADFGLARVFQDNDKQERLYSHQVATRWYRAPELLYGARKYDEGMDIWAVGCIFGELLNNSPLFPFLDDSEKEGDYRGGRVDVGFNVQEESHGFVLRGGESDIEQLCKVLEVLGTPTEDTWPIKLNNEVSLKHLITNAEKHMGVSDLPDYGKITFAESTPVPIENIVPDAPEVAVELLKKFLVYPSKQRVAATEALLHDYFFMEPLPAHHSELPIPQRSKKIKRPQAQDFSIDRPITDSLIDPEFVAPYVSRKS